ncbi:hypothetical protein FHX42_002673 [Saccharopolyspora lacisalsi]|uniref:Uncharacterized protein n=1 Tax=Halosaccharopolyspora lacisalsi TaxID=1000566 RepID=A0A839DTM8_9PSEU|nr:hypothetical protein [Halosaccharopolyspora lacisalsi]MBA8825322.1 hypothetical protein [Halosaccharopolyspora lacisalsi]
MAGELNTEVLDDPDSCRTTADWLGQVKPGVTHIGDTVYGQRGASEGFWQGTAGNAARQTLTYQGKDADTLEGLVGQVKTALETFAGEIDTVNQRMHQARTVARDGKLIVTSTAILPPGPAPKGAGTENLPPGPMGQQIETHQSQASQAAIAAHEAKKRAFAEARTTVEDARTKQEEAHKALDKAMKDPLATVKTTKTYSMMVVSGGLSSIKGAHEEAGRLFERASRLDSAASTIQARAAQKTGNLSQIGKNAAAEGENLANKAHAKATNASKFHGPLGSKGRGIVAADPSRWVKSSSKFAKFGSKALRGVPFVGTTFTVVSGGVDVAMGKDVGEAVEDTGANLAGGAAGGWAGAAVGTMICPGVGTVIGGVVGGIGGGLLASWGANAATGE